MVFLFGWFLMKRLDQFLAENQKRIEEETVQQQKPCLRLNGDISPDEMDEALSIMDSYLKKNGLLPEVKQAVLMQKVYLLMQQNRVNELEQPLKEGVALLPESFEGKAFGKLLDKLPEIKKERGLLKPGEEPPLPPGAIRATKMIVPTAPAK